MHCLDAEDDKWCQLLNALLCRWHYCKWKKIQESSNWASGVKQIHLQKKACMVRLWVWLVTSATVGKGRWIIHSIGQLILYCHTCCGIAFPFETVRLLGWTIPLLKGRGTLPPSTTGQGRYPASILSCRYIVKLNFRLRPEACILRLGGERLSIITVGDRPVKAHPQPVGGKGVEKDVRKKVLC